MPVLSTIHEFLREAHVPYTVVPHSPAFTAQEDAAATHVPGRDWAKVVVCIIDGHVTWKLEQRIFRFAHPARRRNRDRRTRWGQS